MRITELRNMMIGVKQTPASDGVIAHWELSFTDRASGDITWVGLTDEIAAQVAEKLNGGILIPKPTLVLPNRAQRRSAKHGDRSGGVLGHDVGRGG